MPTQRVLVTGKAGFRAERSGRAARISNRRAKALLGCKQRFFLT
jgi:hypothetical protein